MRTDWFARRFDGRTITIALCFSTAVLVLLGAAPRSASAQNGGDVGVGMQLGEPAGLSLRVDRASGASVDLLAAFDLDDFFYLNGHLLYEDGLGDDPDLHVFYGPGAFVGLHDQASASDEAGVGISGTVGLGYDVRAFEIYARITPRLALLPGTEGDVGGGLGVRWYF